MVPDLPAAPAWPYNSAVGGIETDYLVVGAGAAGMAFADALIACRRRRSAGSGRGTPGCWTGPVVRLGRVTHIGPDRIELAGGSIPTDRRQVHVDCSAAGLRTAPGLPVFAGGRITLQQIRSCQPVFSAALTGYVEAARDDDAAKNVLCPANPYPDSATDWIGVTCVAQRAEVVWAADHDLSSWLQRSRLNATAGIRDHLDDPLLQSALARLFTSIEPAIAKLETFGPT